MTTIPADTSCVLRGALLSYHDDPDLTGEQAYRYIEDGALHIESGKIKSAGEARDLLPSIGHLTLHDYRGCLIMPGFIDAHCHFPQIEMVASHGKQLLDWLQDYTFPAEGQFADRIHAEQMADFFLREMLRQGTTSAAVYATVHPQSVDAFFTASAALNTRMICGKVMMDSLAPEWLRDQAEQSYLESKRLLQKWHQNGRQLYAITPRFALSSTAAQLKLAGQLYAEYPDCYLQTHLSENQHELTEVRQRFPGFQDYLAVYEQFGLLGPRSLFGHGIHLSDDEFTRLHAAGSHIVFCPSSNLFLGSGLLDLQRFRTQGKAYAIGTDVGAGPSLSMLKTLSDAYKVAQLRGDTLDPLKSFYLATLGNARMLKLEDKIGSLNAGNEADLVVLDLQSNPLLKLRSERAGGLAERLFALIMLGDDRAIKATYVAGVKRHALN